MSILRQLEKILLDFFFPPRCIGCGSEDGFLCPKCSQLLPRLEPPYCARCGIPTGGGGLCSQCIKLHAINGIRSPFLYQGLAREAVLRFKRFKALAEPLGGLSYHFLHSNPLPVDLLTAVPLHPRRIRERGYNQSLLLARELGGLSGLSLIEDCLLRLRNTPSQVRLNGEERYTNVQGAFGCKDGRFQDKHVLLIDDVCTTAATLDACASALKEAGAISVWGLTLAREC